MVETIFFATFQSSLKRSDRRQYFNTKKTLYEFNNWIEEQRKLIEEHNKTPYTVESINFIELLHNKPK